MAYTGRKLGEYIWIPKSKTYLREYREVLKLCKKIQDRDGYFSDKSLGLEMVSQRAIVDRDSTAESYVHKYEDKSIGNQSYVSNARMLIRIFRWLGFVTCNYFGKKGKFYLTPCGKTFSFFKGEFPDKYLNFNEYDIFLEAFGVMRFQSVNDNINYRNAYFNQRMFFNMIRFLDNLEYASHYELALSSLVLKDESEEEINDKLDKIYKCRSGQKNIRWLMNEYGLDCDDKSKVTGIYDGPKVLLSFARQLGLVEELNLIGNSNAKRILNTYKRMYSDSGYITSKSIKKISKITPLGKEFVKKYKDFELVRFEYLKNPIYTSAVFFVSYKKGGIDNKNIDIGSIDLSIFIIKNNFIYCKSGVLYDLYRDIPFENRNNVIEEIKKLSPDYFIRETLEERKEFINILTGRSSSCINCSNLGCKIYSKHIDTFGASDRFSDQVCPENIISTDDNGLLSIRSSDCASCGLCYFRCPIKGIEYGVDYKFYKNGSNENLKLVRVSEKEIITKNYLIQYSINDKKIRIDDIPLMLQAFIKHITQPGNPWNKDKCYLYVRNVFRSFGVHAVYSGSGGMKTRSDVTILLPFIAVSEVKSPAESPINMKSVRQAVDAAVQIGTKLTIAIGHTIQQGAVDQEKKYYNIIQIGVLLLEIKYLAFFQYLSGYIDYNPDSLKRLIESNHGVFDKISLVNFLKDEIKYGTKCSLGEDELINLINLCF